MLNGLRILTITSLLLAAPSAAQAAIPKLGDPIRVTPTDAPRFVSSTLSGQGQNTAIVLYRPNAPRNRYSVRYQDIKHRWHVFTLVGKPTAVRLARLDGGDGLVAWDDGTSVYARRWHRDGRLDAAKAVLTGVQTFVEHLNNCRNVFCDKHVVRHRVGERGFAIAGICRRQKPDGGGNRDTGIGHREGASAVAVKGPNSLCGAGGRKGGAKSLETRVEPA